MARNGRPSTATVKRLYALSGNRCAFPRCTAPLIHEGVVTGEVCHIKAASPEGPRFDAQQTEQERNAFENLVLMCEPHHKVIDADEESYTVERLHQIKQRHEAGQHSEPASGSADLFAAAILGSSVYGDVTNVGNLTIYQGTQLAPTLEARPQLEIGFASSFFLPLQARTTLTPVVGGGGGLYLSGEDTVSIRTDNCGQKSARYLSWAYTFPPGVAVWSGPGYDGKSHYLGMHWLYEPTQIPVYQELLNPGCGVIHPFRIQLPKDGRLEIPIGVSVAMLDESPTHATLVADIPSFLAQTLAREK